MTSSPSEAETTTEDEVEEAVPHPLEGLATRVAETVGGEAVITFDTVKVTVAPDAWAEALTIARDELDLVLFSFLSAVDWANDPQVGDPLEEELETEEFEVLAAVSDLTDGNIVVFSTRISHAEPRLDSLIDVYAGANWHEREAHEMFGIEFSGHPDLSHLYLPDGFLGNPLRKSFPLLSREVKPWPGTVDVEAMPEDEDDEEEAATEESAGDDAGPDGDAAADEENGEEESS